MSKTIPSGLLVTDEVTSFATCWQVRLTDKTVFAFTDHDEKLELRLNTDPDTLTYTPVGGYTRGNITTSSLMDVDNLQIEGAIINELGITLNDIRSGRFDFMLIKVFLVDWSDVEASSIFGQGVVPIALRSGFGGKLTRVDNEYLVEIRGMMERLRLEHGQLFSPLCRVDLGSVECGIDLLAEVKIANADTVQSKREFTAAGPVRVIPIYDTDTDFEAGVFDQTQIAASGVGAPAVLQLVRQTATENGTDLKPYLVETEADLIAMADDLSAHYALINDIALTNLWDPIQDFGGVFDGRGHIISNLEIDTNVNRVGLFGDTLSHSRIFRLGVLIGAAGIKTSVGGIVGTIVGNLVGNLKFCYTEALLVPTRGAVFAGTTHTAGGFMGQVTGTGSHITQCWSNVPVTEWETTGEANVGMFCGNKGGTALSTKNHVDEDISLEQSGPPPHTPSVVPDECAARQSTILMQKDATYFDWDVTDVWDLDEDVDYPRLKIATGPLITDHA